MSGFLVTAETRSHYPYHYRDGGSGKGEDTTRLQSPQSLLTFLPFFSQKVTFSLFFKNINSYYLMMFVHSCFHTVFKGQMFMCNHDKQKQWYCFSNSLDKIVPNLHDFYCVCLPLWCGSLISHFLSGRGSSLTHTLQPILEDILHTFYTLGWGFHTFLLCFTTKVPNQWCSML